MSGERETHVPDLVLEQYRLGELPGDEAERLGMRLRADATLRARLAALEQSDQEIAARYPPGRFAARAREGSGAPRRGVRRLVLAGAVAAGAVAIAFALPWDTIAPSAGGERIKGLSPALVVYRRTAGGSETLADGAPARAGDLLRLGYVAAGRAYGLILSIDGRGIVTVHLPPDGTQAAALRGEGTILLDQAYELDDAPAVERFYFVTAEREFDAAPILDAARRAAARDPKSPPQALPLPRGLGQSTFSIQKEVRP